MENNYNLNRFKEAQSKTYERALMEIQNGKKVNHWMWFIFPQFRGFGNSYKSIQYAINSREEAIAYFNDALLGSRLTEITNAFLAIENKSALDILDNPDDLKMKSAMTLFNAIQSETEVFNSVLEKYFNGEKCNRTIKMLQDNTIPREG